MKAPCPVTGQFVCTFFGLQLTDRDSLDGFVGHGGGSRLEFNKKRCRAISAIRLDAAKYRRVGRSRALEPPPPRDPAAPRAAQSRARFRVASDSSTRPPWCSRESPSAAHARRGRRRFVRRTCFRRRLDTRRFARETAQRRAPRSSPPSVAPPRRTLGRR